MFRRFREFGLLGMNYRVGHYMLPFNDPHKYPLVDDKVITTGIAAKFNVPMPETYLVIDSFGDLKKIRKLVEPFDSFVVKPASGSMGNGIVVVKEKTEGGYVKSNGSFVAEREMGYHMSGILSGLYSLDGYPDRVIVQYLVRYHSVFDDVTWQGVPDIRIIVFRGYPVLAMLRLPTAESQGRANLHQGAIGVGIDMQTGRTTTSVHKNRYIERHVDTGAVISGIEIPYWNEMMVIAALGFDMTGLGYLGVDIILDREKGPLMLEMNARPGLAIQLANHIGLKNRLQVIEREVPIQAPVLPTGERVQRSLQLFFGNR